MADIFGKTPLTQQTPLTADRCQISFSGTGIIGEAINVQIQYGQQVTRRRSIGNKSAVIYGSQPQGQLSMGRMITTNADDIFSADAWTGCKGGNITLTLSGGCGDDADTSGDQTVTCKGCIATSYNITVNAEDLSVMDNVTIEFLELDRQ